MANVTATRQRLERHGIVIPNIAITEAERAHLPLEDLCAFLMQETAGGHNVFGHDPSIYAGAGLVTKAKYDAYKRLRGHTRMQGVGPLQLTWWSFQDAADRLGGCYQAKYNVREGARIIAEHVRASGLWKGAHDYNGSGPAAVHYANSIVRQAHTWKLILAGKIRLIGEQAFANAEAELEEAHKAWPLLLLTPRVPQTYMPKAYCWNHRTIQNATKYAPTIERFMHKHPYLRIFEGYARYGHVSDSDHHCGYADDLVPLTTDARGKTALQKAEHDAKQNYGAVFTELEWTATNKHLHVSWARCPR